TRRYSGVASNSWDHEIYDVKETPDGGLIVVGMSRDKKYPWEDPQMRGWLLKLDAFGCLVPGCQANDPSITQEISPLQVKLYPNPAADWLYLHLGQVASSGVLSFQLLDAQGRIQQTGTLPEAQTTYLLDVASLPSGTYFLQIQEPGKIPYSETIVIQR
ncbi:MAG: T9SS type A sorting domain-containing protein, partial [Bacteroidota bacterium]